MSNLIQKEEMEERYMNFAKVLIITLICLTVMFGLQNSSFAQQEQEAEKDQSDAVTGKNVEETVAEKAEQPEEETKALKTMDKIFTPVSFAKDILTVGGYAQVAYKHQMDTEFNNDDNDGFLLQSARLGIKGAYDINSWFGMAMEMNFDISSGSLLVRDIYATLNFLERAVMLDVGQFKVPYSMLELTSESKLQFATPAPVSDLTLGRDIGIQLRGEIDTGHKVWIGYQAGIFNGEGANALKNTDSKFLYSFRLEIDPLGKVTLDEADLNNSDFRFAVSGGLTYIPSVARQNLGKNDIGAEEIRYNAGLRLKFRGLSIRGEYLGATVDLATVNQNSYNSYKRYGFYAQAGYVLPLPWFNTPKFEIVFRYDQTDINNKEDGWTVNTAGIRKYDLYDYSEIRHIDIGANMYVLDHRLKLQFLYRLTDFLEGPKTDNNGDVLLGDSVWVQLQIGWL